jgi:hypothetical protein
MIVQPDFPEHWKTLLLVKITGDESAPIAVIRLWAHCQHNRRSKFPDMTPAQLASICRWNDRKPACHVALVKAGFVEKLTPRGFAAHEWDQHNAQLLQKWLAGQKGGRPPTAEKDNEISLSEKPTDNRPLTGTKPDRLDQTRPDQIDQTKPVQIDATPPSDPNIFQQLRASLDAPKDGLDSKDASLVGKTDGRTEVDGLASSISRKLTPQCGIPNISQVRSYLLGCFNGAVDYADAFYKAMEKQHWQDKHRKPITDWKAMAKSYASKCYRKR